MMQAQGVMSKDFELPPPRIYEFEMGAERRNPGVDYLGPRAVEPEFGSYHIKPGLRILSLEVMYDYALRASVPFQDLAPAMALPPQFEPLKAKAIAGQQLSASDMELARGYIHPSSEPFARGIVPGMVNYPENDYVREVIPNRPGRAVQ